MIVLVVVLCLYIIIGITVARLSLRLHPKRREALDDRLAEQGVSATVPMWVVICMLALIWPLHLWEWIGMARGEHGTKK